MFLPLPAETFVEWPRRSGRTDRLVIVLPQGNPTADGQRCQNYRESDLPWAIGTLALDFAGAAIDHEAVNLAPEAEG